jgi:hypothetical protein
MQCGNSSGNDRPANPRQQSSTHPAWRVRKDPKNCEGWAAYLRDDYNLSSSSTEELSQMSKSSGPYGSGQKKQDFAFQEPEAARLLQRMDVSRYCCDTIYNGLGPQ